MINMNNDPISRIVIAGNGLEAWLTALNLLRSLDRNAIKIVVCPVAGSGDLDAIYSIMPSDSVDNQCRLGISNVILAKRCNAAFSLGMRFRNLSRPYGPVGIDYLGAPFHHHWLRRAESQSPGDYFSYSPGTVAMANHAFAPPVARNAIGPLQHEMARHVDAPKLAALLRERALTLGAYEAAGQLETVSRTSGYDRISALFTTTGEELEADLFIDCTGPQRRLMADAAGCEWIPAPQQAAYEITFDKVPGVGALPSCHSISTTDSGWQVDIPCFGKQIRIQLSEAEVSGSAQPYFPGHISQPWTGNCVAIGTAAAQVLPLEAMPAKFLMISLERLITLLPGSDCSASETLEFNQLTLQDVKEVQDYDALFELARREGGLEGLDPADFDLSPGLTRKIMLFGKRGWVSPADSELLSSSDWSSVFLFLGLIPGCHDPLAERLPLSKLKEQLHGLKAKIQQVAAEFPPHGDYLNAVRSQPMKQGPQGPGSR